MEAKAKLAAANAATENDPNKPPEEKKEGAPQPQVVNYGNKKDNSQELAENIENLEKQLTPWEEEPVKLQEYDKEEKNIYLCLDTLGQDRVFSEEEIKYIKKIGANIKESLEQLEKSLLEKDRDIRIKFLDKETQIKTEEKYSDEKFEECMNTYINQFYSSEEYKSKGITDENIKAFEGDLARMKYLKNLILEGECLNILLIFKDLDINENKTNRLEWKKARNYWTNIFPYIKEYNPVGPKPEQIKNIYKLNKIKENLESVLDKRNDIKNYSQTLLMFIDFVLHLIKVRHDDILRRLCNVAVFKDKREQIIKNNKEIDEERQKIIDEAKALNPNVKVPGEGELNAQKRAEENVENKEGVVEEEKKEENKEEEKPKEEGENLPQNENNENKEENKEEELNEDKQNEIDSQKLADQLMKFDEEHAKNEVPDDIEYDVDNDYDIDQNEKDTIINAALQAANNPTPVVDKKK
jgi:hypothetical protein